MLRLLDGMVAPGVPAGREPPFSVDKPDENLVSWIERGLIEPGRALDVGCGPARRWMLRLALAPGRHFGLVVFGDGGSALSDSEVDA